ncbi:phospholipid-transporting ATPase ABCA1-like [Ruditapes philippinarum]|uniref:phospholipid-transporting ATPase ABCA1-like n=1 Tax=Ruditapes philippinarum TaxID=129788 RepID=UPI00295BAC6A|nr:phospholipid-transporting ATPase ABCA1-like [Ruditapes philippinarum]
MYIQDLMVYQSHGIFHSQALTGVEHHWETCCLKSLFGVNRSRRRYYLVNDDPENDDVTVDDDSGIYWCGCNTDCICTLDIKPDLRDLTRGEVVTNLRKVYKKGDKSALDSLSMKLYKNQITSFLGHNGAGKTSTMLV